MHIDIGELTPEDLAVLEALESSKPVGAPNKRNGRYRQTYRGGKYRGLVELFDASLKTYFATKAYDKASVQARQQARERGDDDLLPEPTKQHVKWWFEFLRADHNKAVKAMLERIDLERGISPYDRPLMREANRKLIKRAERYRAGEDHPAKNNVERKLMSPAEMKAHDNRKRAAAQRARRARKRNKVLN